MLKMREAVAHDNFFGHAKAGELLCFELVQVESVHIAAAVQRHIEQG